MAYVPPHLRNKQPTSSFSPQRLPNRINERIERERAQQEKQRKQKEIEEAEASLEKTDKNFPSLGNAIPRTCAGGGTKSYTELAKNLQEHDDAMKVQEELAAMRKARTGHKVVKLPVFENQGHYPEEPPQEAAVPKEDDEYEWKTVSTRSDKRSKREEKKKREAEKTFEQFEAEENDEEPPTVEDTVWACDDEW